MMSVFEVLILKTLGTMTFSESPMMKNLISSWIEVGLTPKVVMRPPLVGMCKGVLCMVRMMRRMTMADYDVRVDLVPASYRLLIEDGLVLNPLC